MEWALGLIFFALISMNLLHNSRLKELAAKLEKVPTPAKAITSKVSGHTLVKTYISDSDHWIKGWRFKCSCGAVGPSDNLKAATYTEHGRMGTEASAIEKFKTHRDSYLDANGPDLEEHEDTIKLRKVEGDFATYRKACYCKDTNDDLRIMDFEYSLTTKPISE